MKPLTLHEMTELNCWIAEQRRIMEAQGPTCGQGVTASPHMMDLLRRRVEQQNAALGNDDQGEPIAELKEAKAPITFKGVRVWEAGMLNG